MRVLLTVGVLLSATMSLQAETYVYASMAPEQKIQVYRLGAEDGTLTPVAALAVEGSPGSLGVDPQGRYLFASLRTTTRLASFQIDPATGKLRALSQVDLPRGANAAYVGTDRTGRWLVSASYSGAKVVVHRLEEGKIQTPPVQTIETARTAHSAVTDPGNRFVFVPHVAPNAVYQFQLDADTGKLTGAGQAPGGSPQAGPRHLAFHPTLPLAFTSDESGSSITCYRFDPMTGLKPAQTLSTLPDGFTERNSTAEVKVHPSGKLVWVSNRGHDSLAGFAIDAGGKLTAVGQTPTEKTPRSFDIDPDGRFVVAAGEGTGKLAVYRVDVAAGKLTRLHTVDVGKSVPWVLLVKVGNQ